MGKLKPPFPVEVVREEHGLEPIKAKALLSPTPPLPTVSQTRTITTSSGGEADEEFRELIRPNGKALINELLALAFSEETKDTVKLNVIKELFDRGWGKPTQIVTSQSTTADLSGLHFHALKNNKKDQS